MGDMYIAQLPGSRNYSLHWRDGHGTWPPGGEPAHPTVWGWLVGNHSMMPSPNTPHFNWCETFLLAVLPATEMMTLSSCNHHYA